jgi:hypothetical protein
MKIKLHSQYNHFPTVTTSDDDYDIELWNDGRIWEYISYKPRYPRASALLIEPRSIMPETYAMVEKNYAMFDHIFTHDGQLLRYLPNAKPIIYWRDYELHDEVKTKDISFICGNKNMCLAHNIRMQLAQHLQDKVDVLGDWNGGERVSTRDAYAPYKFAIVIENYADHYWMTEKILNAFANKTVPIYLGATNIYQFFERHGIIEVNNIWNLIDIVSVLKEMGINNEYNRRRVSINNNYKKVQQFKNFEDWFINNYEEIIC